MLAPLALRTTEDKMVWTKADARASFATRRVPSPALVVQDVQLASANDAASVESDRMKEAHMAATCADCGRKLSDEATATCPGCKNTYCFDHCPGVFCSKECEESAG